MPNKKLNLFYPRKVVKQGSSRTIAVGKILPADWLVVRIVVVERSNNSYVLRLDRIM